MKFSGLTAKQIQHLKPDPNRRIEVPAGPPAGLYLVVQPNGSKSWALRYRWLKKTRKLTLPGYPDLGLAAARAEAEVKLAELARGVDPAQTQKEETEAGNRLEESVESVVKEYTRREIRTGPDKDKRWKLEIVRILNREVSDRWRHRMIADIAKPDVLRALDEIVDRGASVMACRTRGTMMRFFAWAQERGYTKTSPMLDIGKPGLDHRERERVLSPAELSEVLRATEDLGYPVTPFILLLILTAQRRGEVATMRWRDVNIDDPAKGLWVIPAESTKPGRIHDVPLSAAVVDRLTDLPRFTGGDFLFTNTNGAKAINSFSDIKAVVDAATLKRRVESGIETNISHWTLHDLRRTAATHMAGAGVPPHVLSAILNHAPGATQGVTAIYNRFRYSEERRAALQAWADSVLALVPKVPRAASA